MILKDDLKLLRTGKLVLILILLSLISCLFVSCGKDSKNPVSPGITPLNPFEWTVVAPAEQGFDSDLLDTLTEKIYFGQFGRITSLLIVRNGYLAYEEYFRGKDSADLVQIYSCTKSVVSALMGIAINKGSIGGVDDRLFDYLDGYTLFPSGTDDSLHRENLTVEHLLTMTAGFSWEEWDIPYGQSTNSYTRMVNSDNWIQYTLNQPVVHSPGTTFEYNTGLSGLMAVILRNSTGQRVDHYARDKLFHYIGIDTCIWRLSPMGVHMTGNGLELRPRDMAKFGWLYAQNGVWEGRTVVPSSWIQESFQQHTTFPNGLAYGYQRWMAPITDSQGNPIHIPYALGWGGQFIFVSQENNLVIVITANDDINVYDSYIDEIMNLIGQAFTP